MVAIVVVSFALYVGLSIYNRLLAMKKLKNFTESNSSLKTPETVENSVTMYITKNRLK